MQTVFSTTHRAWARSIFTIALASALLFASRALCQVAGTGNIQGTVSDSTGAAVPNASVVLTSEATRESRRTTSDTAGIYAFPGVAVGKYDLTVRAPGFRTYSQIGIVLEVGSSIAINPGLVVGSAETKIEVQAEGLQLQTEDPTFKQTIDQNELTAMPLVSRQMTNLIMLSGGANTAPSNDIVGTKSSYQTISLSIAGGGGNTTIWRLDGGDNQDYMVNGNMPYPFPDAVSQFSVESTVLGAQDGGHVGGMVNVVTRSGTNEFHGTAFEFIRNNYIDATSFFSISPDVLHQNQFGGTFGGPIKRNKLFAFAGYQRTTHTQEQASQEKFVPTAANLQGDFSVTDGPGCQASGTFVQLVDPITGAKLPGDIYPTPPTYNAQALALVKYFPQPIPAVDTNNCGLVKYSIPLATYDNEFVTR